VAYVYLVVFMPIIETNRLKKVFRTRGRGVEAVSAVTMSVKAGEIFGFLGPNGAGKTTTMRMLTTLLEPSGGQATVAGFDLLRESDQVRKHIGYVSQSGGVERSATARENLVLQARLYGLSKAAAHQRAQALIKALDLTQSRARLWDEINRLRNEHGTTIFITTHYLDEADALCDRVAIIDHGVIVAQDTPATLKRQIAGDVITVGLHSDSTAKAQQLLAEQSCVRSIKVDKENLRLYVEQGEKALPDIVRLLDTAHIGVTTVSLNRPTLDDVFLKQTGRSLRETQL
jgi:ABC-2 type transport system ATP-binding protein